MKQLKSPKRKMQLEKDYLRKKVLRKIKKRNKRRLESDKKAAEKQLKRLLTKRN